MINNSPVKPNRKKGVIPAFANVGVVDKYVGLGNYNRLLGNFSEYKLKRIAKQSPNFINETIFNLCIKNRTNDKHSKQNQQGENQIIE